MHVAVAVAVAETASDEVRQQSKAKQGRAVGGMNTIKSSTGLHKSKYAGGMVLQRFFSLLHLSISPSLHLFLSLPPTTHPT